MTSEQRAALREAASKATPGPWAVEDVGLNISPDVMQGDRVVASTVTSDMAKAQDKANAAYIALAHPDAVLALLDALDAAERERDDWRQGARAEAAIADTMKAERDAAAAALAEVVRVAVEREREACALVVDSTPTTDQRAAREVMQRIRARSTERGA
jgi:hypothetical protein